MGSGGEGEEEQGRPEPGKKERQGEPTASGLYRFLLQKSRYC